VTTAEDRWRSAWAILFSALVLLAASVVGLVAAGLAVGLLARVLTPGTATALTLVVALLAVAAGALWLTARGVDRVRGGRFAPASDGPVTVPVLLGASLAALAVTLLAGGVAGGVGPALLRSVAVVLAAAVGLGLGGWVRRGDRVGRPRERRPSPHPRSSSEAGAASAEHVAVVAIVAAVVAALFAIPIAPVVTDWGRYAVCSLFSAEGACERPGTELAGGEPAYACTVIEAARGANANLSFIVAVDRNVDYTTTVASDGTVQLTYSNDVALGAGVGGGLQTELYWGEGQLTLGAQASAGGRARFVEGDVYEWTGPEARVWADRYRDVHAISSAPADVALGGRQSLLGRAYGGLVRGGNALLNAAPVVDGIDYRAPERTLVHRRGGIELEASGTAGAYDVHFGAQDASLEASLSRAIGTTTDERTGERIVHLIVEESVAAAGNMGTVDFVAAWGNESIISVRVGADNTPVEATVVTYRIDEAGRDPTATAGHRADAFPDRRFADGTLSGASLSAPSLYEVQTRLDLRDPEQREVLDRVVVGGALQLAGGVGGSYAGERVLGPVHERGSTTIVEYDVSDRRYGADIEAGAVAEVSGGASLLASDRQAAAAYYFDEVFDAYVPWASCVP
jgi:hypothetical protein